MKHILTLAALVFATSCFGQFTGFSAVMDTIWHADGADDIDGLEFYGSYSIYANFTNPTDVLSVLYSDVEALGTPAAGIEGTCGCFQSVIATSPWLWEINPALIPSFPDLQYSTGWTIGLYDSGPGAVPPLTQDFAGPCEGFTTTNGAMFVVPEIDFETGQTIGPDIAVAGPDLKVLVARVTTCGDFTLQSCVGTFPGGDQSVESYVCAEPFTVIHPYQDGECLNDADGDGVCDEFEVLGCADPAACNFDPEATQDDMSCVYATDLYDCDEMAGLTGGLVTFNVDMAGFNGEFEYVNLSGPFNGWCTACDIMIDDNGDGIYSLQMNLPAGYVEYKYVADDYSWEELTPELDCVTDADGYVNRTLVVNGNAAMPVVCWSECESCIGGCTDATACNFEVAASVDDGSCDFDSCSGGTVTFSVDMAGYPGSFNSVNLNGTFNGWCGSCMELTDNDGDGLYSLDVELAAGFTEYLFSVDGWTDLESFEAGEPCTVTTFGYTSRALQVNGNAILPTVCWNQCQGCVPGLGCTDINACNYDGEATEENGSCEYSSCAGCLDALACNYNESAQYDDPSTCEYSSCSGCLDASACNYNENAQYNDPTSCNYPLNPCEICSGGTDGAGEVVFNDADGDGQCDAIPTFENVVVSVQHNTPCGTTLNITCDATIPTPAYVGFYIGCYGFTGTPVRIDEGGITQFELSWECGQLPLYASADQELQDYIDMYQCYEELNVVSSIDSCLWWNGGWGNGTCMSDLGPGGFNGFSGSVEVMSNLSDFGTSSDYLYEMDALFNQLILEGYLTECADGTIWSNTAQECVPALAADLDFDGCVGMTDLLDLLSVFGTCNETPWSCGDPLEYQGYDYETVQIGEQCWFAENLRSESYANGDEIPVELSDEEWSSTTSGAMAVYGEGSSACFSYSLDGDACDESWSLDEYGGLYNWYSVVDARGLCPSGWHVASDSEWTALTEHLGGSIVAGSQMKTTYGWSNGGNGTNSSGFSGLPGGFRDSSGYFSFAGNYGNMWSSSPSGSDAWYRYLYDYHDDIFRSDYDPRSGFSVRCIKDSE